VGINSKIMAKTQLASGEQAAKSKKAAKTTATEVPNGDAKVAKKAGKKRAAEVEAEEVVEEKVVKKTKSTKSAAPEAESDKPAKKKAKKEEAGGRTGHTACASACQKVITTPSTHSATNKLSRPSVAAAAKVEVALLSAHDGLKCCCFVLVQDLAMMQLQPSLLGTAPLSCSASQSSPCCAPRVLRACLLSRFRLFLMELLARVGMTALTRHSALA
jgi:hypothetical protein